MEALARAANLLSHVVRNVHARSTACVSVSAHVHVHDSGPAFVHVRPSIRGTSVGNFRCFQRQCDAHGVCSVELVLLWPQLNVKSEEGPSGVVVCPTRELRCLVRDAMVRMP